MSSFCVDFLVKSAIIERVKSKFRQKYGELSVFYVKIYSVYLFSTIQP